MSIADIAITTVGAAGALGIKEFILKPILETAYDMLASGVSVHIPALALPVETIDELSRSKSGNWTGRLADLAKLRRSKRVKTEGIFIPGPLLTAGWWRRKSGVRAKQDWSIEPGLQEWLYSGFEQWAPSWAFCDDEDETENFFIGQIGVMDEADSIPVIVCGARLLKSVRANIAERQHANKSIVSRVTVTGLLCTGQAIFDNIPEENKETVRALLKMNGVNHKCIIVNGEIASHAIDFHTSKIEFYSGYLWRCVCPQRDNIQPDLATISSSFFVWEHTNFADASALKYDLDSLDRKIEYIRSLTQRRGLGDDLTMLQEMMPEYKLRGEETSSSYVAPALKNKQFVDLLKVPR